MDADELAEQFEDKASMRAAGGGGSKSGGRKAGGGKPGDGGKQREKQISMALSRLLRHQALNAGIKLDKEGYAPLDRVVSPVCTCSFSFRLAVCFSLRRIFFGRDGGLVSASSPAQAVRHDIMSTGTLSP